MRLGQITLGNENVYMLQILTWDLSFTVSCMVLGYTGYLLLLVFKFYVSYFDMEKINTVFLLWVG